jgi:hypothetical protein
MYFEDFLKNYRDNIIICAIISLVIFYLLYPFSRGIYLLGFEIDRFFLIRTYENTPLLVIGLSIILVLIRLYQPLFNSIESQTKIKNDIIIKNEEERFKIINSFSETNTGDIDDYFTRILQVNLNYLNDYYQLIGSQAKESFKYAIRISFFGLLLISISILSFIFSKSVNENLQPLTFLSGIAGIIIQFISGVCFYLYTQSQRYLKEYQNTLINVQNTLISLFMLKGIDDKMESTKIISNIIKNLTDLEKFQ